MHSRTEIRSIRLLPFLASGLCLVLALTLAPAALSAEEGAQAAPNDYSDPATWLCRPGREDACTVDLSTTVLYADGKTELEEWEADPKAPIDCFYVYPTVSLDPTPNSDMSPGPEELSVVRSQLARFGSVCRIYAPLYRQLTLTGLRARLAGGQSNADPDLPISDVTAAWNYYLEHDNAGRRVVLIGHSQGSSMLTSLIQNEIDGKPVQDRIVSAMLLGWNVAVPKGKDVGGAFQHLPLCKSKGQTGCLITYASFRATSPPPADSLFGRVPGEGNVSACTNPAALGGGSGELHAYMSSQQATSSSATAPDWTSGGEKIETPFVSLPGLLSAECRLDEHGSYLAITVHGDPKDPRVDDIVGDVVIGGNVAANWGLHLIDVNLAIGNLVDIVKQQSKAYLSK